MQRKLWKKKAGKYKGLQIVAGLVMLILMWGNTVKAQEPVFPTPTGNPAQLFYLQRTPNVNTIVCELKYEENGAMDTTNPVHVFWIRYGEQGQRAELSFIQRKFAYGVSAKKVGVEKYELHFVSYKKYSMYLMKGTDRKFHVYASINKKWVILNRIYIKIKEGGSFWSPNIEHVELYGSDPITGEAVMETMKV
ncbi:MAG: DUF4833 domain-containing protein [Chitinophagaceae bacterium]